MKNGKRDLFDLTENDLTQLEIRENKEKNSCYIQHIASAKIYYTFILDKNSKTKICCTVNFFPSSETERYLPRLSFKKVNTDNSDKTESADKPVNIDFSEGKSALSFWSFINFLGSRQL